MPSAHTENQRPPPTSLSIIFCLVLFFVLSPELLQKEENVNRLGEEFVKKKMALYIALCFITASGSFI